jgi:hypothetical protein
MSKRKKLPLGSGAFLMMIGGLADGTKLVLTFLFGIGFILNPLIISPITWLIFWITLSHYDIPMMSGKGGTAGWINIFIAEVPGVDAVPDWTTYAIYLTMVHGDFGSDDEIVERMQGIIR